ncbi:MAG: MraY family glycosyltransferase [Nitrospiraceae bacterium]
MHLYAVTCVLALALALYGVPLARRAALLYNIVDKPDGKLKQQREPVPYLGGLAIYLAFLMSLAFTFEFRHDVLGIILGGTIVVMLGLIDDFGVLSPMTKLIGQLLAVFILIKSGIRISIAALPDWLDLALTVWWMVGLINAFNLLDIMDGLAAGVGVVCATCLLIVSLLNGDQGTAVMSAALVGSLLGFLRYNWHPANIYMGDTGAMFIGLMLGALSMIGQYAARQDLALLSPILILGVPIFDTLFVMYVRYRRGLPMFLGSPDHMPLRLRRWGLSVTQVVAVSYAASAFFGGLGILLIFADRQAALVICLLSGALALAAAYALLRVDTRASLAAASGAPTSIRTARKARSA